MIEPGTPPSVPRPPSLIVGRRAPASRRPRDAVTDLDSYGCAAFEPLIRPANLMSPTPGKHARAISGVSPNPA